MKGKCDCHITKTGLLPKMHECKLVYIFYNKNWLPCYVVTAQKVYYVCKTHFPYGYANILTVLTKFSFHSEEK